MRARALRVIFASGGVDLLPLSQNGGGPTLVESFGGEW